MMALEEKFDLQLDEEGEALLVAGCSTPSGLVAKLQCLRCPCPPGACAALRARQATLMCTAGCAAGAEKISTVQEAADLISGQVSSA